MNLPVRIAGAVVGALAALALTGTGNDLRAAEPYVLVLGHSDGELRLEGAVPDAAARAAILAAASRFFPDAGMTVSLVERADASAGFTDAARHALELLARLAEGEARLTDSEVAFSGEAYHPKAMADLAAGIGGGWPPGFVATDSGLTTGSSAPPLDAPACERALAEVTQAEPVEFEAGGAELRAGSRRLLDRIAYLSSRCPDTLVAVAGHTDSDGTEEANHRLSLDRARAVVDILVADGLARARFTALGYGESRPLAFNATDDGKARNRRIEFVLRE